MANSNSGKKKSSAGNQFVIEGELTIYVAAELKEKLGALLGTESPIEIDLSQVSEIDTAGLQLLLLMQQECTRQKKEIAFKNPSSAVLECWRVCNIAPLFGVESAAA